MLAKLLPDNVNNLDRIARVVLGLAAVAMVFVGPQTAWGWVGLVLVATGFIGSCPIYTVTGLKTKTPTKV